MNRRLMWGAVVVFALAAPLGAQEVPGRGMPPAVRDGRRALSFGAFAGGGGAVGLTLMMTSRTAFTLDVQADARLSAGETEVGGAVVNSRDSFDLDVFLAPGFRRYMSGRGNVASYLAGRVLLGFETSIQEVEATSTMRLERMAPSVGGALGFGLEWFVTDAMSLRGEVAVDASYARSTERGPDPDSDDESRSTSLRAGLGQSGLAVSIWF